MINYKYMFHCHKIKRCVWPVNNVTDILNEPLDLIYYPHLKETLCACMAACWVCVSSPPSESHL